MPFSFIKKFNNNVLFKNTLIYTVLNILNNGIPFLLLPILTRYLTTQDYGIIATFNSFIVLVTVFVGLSMPGAIGVSFFQLNKLELKKYINGVFIILCISSVSTLLLLNIFEPFIIEKLKLPTMWVYIAVLIAVMKTFTLTNLTLWRSNQEAKPFAIYELSQTLLNVGLSLYLIVFMQWGWEGRLWGSSIAFILFGIVSIFFIYKRGYVAATYSVDYLKDALKFGVELVPHQLALWMRSGVDILLITLLVGVSATGLYSVGFQFGMVIGIFAQAFNNAFSPYLYKQLQNSTLEKRKQLVKFTYLYFIGILLFSILLSIFFIWLVPYFLGKDFHNVLEYIFYISIAYAFHGMYLMVVNYIFYAKKNYLLSSVTITTSIIHVILSYLFIHQFGAIGAAYASVISYFLTFILVWYISARVVKMPWFGQ